MSEVPPNSVTFNWSCLTGVIICGAHLAPFVKRGMTSVMRRQSSTSNENEMRLRNNHRSSHPTTAGGDSPPSSPTDQTGNRSTGRACCFCWCCCCTCSWYRMHVTLLSPSSILKVCHMYSFFMKSR